MAWNSKSSLASLKSRVLRFAAEWRQATGRQLATARDGLDFLTAMKRRDDFWSALAPSDPAAALPIDAAALRAALPDEELPRDLRAEDYLRSIGLSETEIEALVTGLDGSVLFESAIRSAFDERSPQKIARALERVLDTDRDVLATASYVGRMPESSGLGRTLGVMMGTALLLVGTTLAGCGPQSTGAPTPPPTNQQNTAPNAGGGTNSTPDPGTPDPPPPTPPQPPPPPDPSPNPPGPPAPAYKGVSPRRTRSRARSGASRATPR